MRAQAGAIGAATLVRTIDELASALTAVREGDDARMAVEIALLKAARPDLDPDTAGLLRRIERLEKQLSGGERPVAETPPAAEPPPPDEPPVEPSPADPPAPAPSEDPPPAEEEEAETEPPAEPAPSEPEPAGHADLSLDEIQRVWPAVLHKLSETAPALAATLEGARPVSFGEEGLEVGFPAEMTFNKKKADSADRRDTVAAAFAAVTGTGLRPTYVVLDGEAPPDTPAPGSEEIDEKELLERLKSEFDAEEVS
jgi:DNA polymerase-3 subunit gamma/tau